MSKSIAYEFVLEGLNPLKPLVRAMFGAHALYVGEKILVILREKESAPQDNGIWVATEPEHHQSLRAELPLQDIALFGGGPTAWQNLPASHPQFESLAERLIEMILGRDPRIGKIPGTKKKKKTAKPQAKGKAVSKPKSPAARSKPSPKKPNRTPASKKKKTKKK